MAREPEELIVDADALPWKPVGEGAWAKVLRVSVETGSWTVLLKQAKGSVVPPHRHLGPAEFYVLSGAVEYRAGIARAGFFAREPLGAVHEKTTFPEDTVYLFTAYGPLAMFGPDGEIAFVTDAQTMQALADA